MYINGQHTHWLYGYGPDKIVRLKVAKEVETNCQDCVHVKVCARRMTEQCENNNLGTSEGQWDTCQQCTHRYSRFDKDPVPCFQCKDFLPKAFDL